MENHEYGTWLLVLALSVYIVKQATRGAYFNGPELLKGKTVIVTGANSGIGFETALEIAKRQANLILACRDIYRGTDAVKKIIDLSSNPNIKFRQLDLASLNSIRKFADAIKKEEQSLYGLVNNAGIFWCPLQWTKDGFEANFGVNHLGHFLLTLLLLPLLDKNQDGSRLVTVASLMHMFGRIDFGDLNCGKKSYNFISAYSASKLANVLFIKFLKQNLRSQNIKVFCADPGIVYSDIGRNSAFMSSMWYKVVLRPIVWLLFKDSNGGAQTTLHCLLSAKLKNENRYYCSECEPRHPWPSSENDHAMNNLWKESLKLVNMKEVPLLDSI